MSRIRILPDILSNKIAAGEVVERPASVVKELVENAIDAGSSRIFIEVGGGGKTLVRVSDDGAGMGRDDALLSIERYATSKIYTDEDLFSIQTLGFRGEALPSIAAVSTFSLVTREKDADAGTEILIEGGKIRKVSQIGAPPGTMITVKGLFYNTPARRKFLKTVATEMGHISDVVASMALVRPAVQFRLDHNGNRVRNWAATPETSNRIADVLGQGLRQQLHRLSEGEGGVFVDGWIGTPEIARATSRGIYVFVNGRYVKDRIIQHALVEGYAGRLMKGRFPVAVLFITLPFHAVDVNVHPTKHEVRFSDPTRIHDTVSRAARKALQKFDRPEWPSRAASSSVAELPKIYGQPSPPASAVADRNKRSGPAPAAVSPGTAPLEVARLARDEVSGREPGIAPVSAQAGLFPETGFSQLRVIGQYHNTYLVGEVRGRLVLIDQHAAHERILYERLKGRAADRPPAVQRLLVPETIDLGFKEAEIMNRMLPELRKCGLEIEPFGGNTFVITAVPSLLADLELKPLVIEIVEKTAEIGFGSGPDRALDESLMIMACHGAIRAHQAMTEKEFQALLAELDTCENPSRCPHGRPTWIEWTSREIEKLFRRIV